MKQMTQWQTLLLGFGSALLLSGVVYLVSSQPRSEPFILLPSATPKSITVQVSGEVLHPGVYQLPFESRVQQAVEAAGGVNTLANEGLVNLAARLEDGQKLIVPSRTDETQEPSVSNGVLTPASLSKKVNINTADIAQLETLPGIGPIKAGNILVYRQKNGFFSSIEELQKVDGIGPELYAAIKDFIRLN